jgi:hypothetical protein
VSLCGIVSSSEWIMMLYGVHAGVSQAKNRI